jgi:glutamate-1-semialdehyde 2,1-aminomutase
MAAGLAALQEIERDPALYDRLERAGAHLEERTNEILERHGYPCRLARVASLWTLFFTDREVRNWNDAATCDTARFARFFQAMLDSGILIAPSQFEANFISTAHTTTDLDVTVSAMGRALEAACA